MLVSIFTYVVLLFKFFVPLYYVMSICNWFFVPIQHILTFNLTYANQKNHSLFGYKKR
jgi:hypothetical protein